MSEVNRPWFKCAMPADDLACIVSTALINGSTLRGKLTNQECVNLAEELIDIMESLYKDEAK